MATKKKATMKTGVGAKATTAAETVPRSGHVLCLRTCAADMTAHGGFRWPTEGEIEAEDWKPTKVCGAGLHGLLWGEGDGGLLCWDPDARWLVVEVEEASIIDLDGKVKFPRARVVFVGDRIQATDFLRQHAPPGKTINGGTATAGDGGTATAGYGGTATAGDGGTATAGSRGTATAGSRGTATAGYGGTATAGDGGTISILYWDAKRGKYRFASAEVGEDGIDASTAYVLDLDGDRPRFVKKVT